MYWWGFSKEGSASDKKRSNGDMLSFLFSEQSSGAELTLNEFFDTKYVPYAEKRKVSIKHDLSTFNNHMRYSLGQKVIEELSPEIVENWKYDQRGRNYRVSTVSKHVFLINRLIFLAKDWGYLSKNIYQVRKTEKLPEGDFKQYFLSSREISLLMSACGNSRNIYLKYFVELLLLTGARHGEALGAHMDNISLSQGIWVVPKSKNGRSWKIVLNNRAARIVSKVRTISKTVPAHPQDQGFLFLNPKTKKPYKSFHAPWDDAWNAAGLENVRIHDLRHTFASILINGGATLYEVQTLLGDSTPQKTQRYAHLSRNTLHEKSELMSNFMSEMSAAE